jgi:hypothetical protein
MSDIGNVVQNILLSTGDDRPYSRNDVRAVCKEWIAQRARLKIVERVARDHGWEIDENGNCGWVGVGHLKDRIKALQNALKDAEKIANAVADSAADSVLTGIPEQARIREGMESAGRKIAFQIKVLREAVDVK